MGRLHIRNNLENDSVRHLQVKECTQTVLVECVTLKKPKVNSIFVIICPTCNG